MFCFLYHATLNEPTRTFRNEENNKADAKCRRALSGDGETPRDGPRREAEAKDEEIRDGDS